MVQQILYALCVQYLYEARTYDRVLHHRAKMICIQYEHEISAVHLATHGRNWTLCGEAEGRFVPVATMPRYVTCPRCRMIMP